MADYLLKTVRFIPKSKQLHVCWILPKKNYPTPYYRQLHTSGLNSFESYFIPPFTQLVLMVESFHKVTLFHITSIYLVGEDYLMNLLFAVLQMIIYSYAYGRNFLKRYSVPPSK